MEHVSVGGKACLKGSMPGRTFRALGSSGRAICGARTKKARKEVLALTFIIIYIKPCNVHFYGR
jgi:hypothetical protein